MTVYCIKAVLDVYSAGSAWWAPLSLGRDDETRPRSGVIVWNFIKNTQEITMALAYYRSACKRLNNGRSTTDFVYIEGPFYYNFNLKACNLCDLRPKKILVHYLKYLYWIFSPKDTGSFLEIGFVISKRLHICAAYLTRDGLFCSYSITLKSICQYVCVSVLSHCKKVSETENLLLKKIVRYLLRVTKMHS